MTKNKCCKYHNKMAFVETDLTDCAMAGMGTPTVCCEDCPANIYPEGMPYYYKTEPTMTDDRQEWEEIYG